MIRGYPCQGYSSVKITSRGAERAARDVECKVLQTRSKVGGYFKLFSMAKLTFVTANCHQTCPISGII